MAGHSHTPNERQRAFNRHLPGANQHSLRRAQQIVQARSFVYDGSLAPVCIRCGNPREDRHGLKCNGCL